MSSFTIGRSEREKVSITVRGYERAASGDIHDDNWLSVVVEVRVGAFAAKCDAAFLAQDFGPFRSQLGALYDVLVGEACFTTLEEQLSLRVVGDGRGGLTVTGEVRDRPGGANRLAFEFALDQTSLPSTLRELDAVVSKFPVRES